MWKSATGEMFQFITNLISSIMQVFSDLEKQQNGEDPSLSRLKTIGIPQREPAPTDVIEKEIDMAERLMADTSS